MKWNEKGIHNICNQYQGNKKVRNFRPSVGSVDNKFAMCDTEASKPSTSFGPSSESSPSSNPVMEQKLSLKLYF